MSTETKPLLLLTGATGYIGYQVLISALRSGWAVRAAVRSISSAQAKLLSTPTLSSTPSLAANLTFVEVPDILAPGAYVSAVTSVTHIIHCASPIAHPHFTNHDADIIQPAIKGTLELLRAAASVPSVQRVVITSSVVANRLLTASPDLVTTAASRVALPEGPFDGIFPAYCASKIAALNEAEAWLAQEKPAFDVVHIHPGFVLGANELATTTKELASGTPAAAIAHLVGPDGKATGPKPGYAVDIRDVAHVHVAALDGEKVAGNRSYGVTHAVVWGDAFGVVEREFPEAVKGGVFKDREAPTFAAPWDASETERVLGIKFRSYEESVVSVAGQWLELLGKESE
ncbi:hypothetical protein MMC10_002874 [Thelotrema lepadinum]|nr:hypothetical protein [Thelotrema lepadinum]